MPRTLRSRLCPPFPLPRVRTVGLLQPLIGLARPMALVQGGQFKVLRQARTQSVPQPSALVGALQQPGQWHRHARLVRPAGLGAGALVCVVLRLQGPAVILV